MSNTLKLIGMSVLSALLLWLAWPVKPFLPLIFIAFVPLLAAESFIAKNYKGRSRWRILGVGYLAFISWNVLCTYWIVHSTLAGGIFAFVVNSLLMSIPFMMFHITRERMGDGPGYLGFIVYWISYEFLHHRWELTWPWLTLGNAPAKFPWSIQWYEYTGTLGGSAMILLINVLIFLLLRSYLKKVPFGFNPFQKFDEARIRKSRIEGLILITISILLPLIISLWMYSAHEEQGDPIEVVVVQPNIDPYNEKYNQENMTLDDQLDRFLNLADQKVTDNTQYLVFPETAIPQAIWLHRLETSLSIERFLDYCKEHPQLEIVTGLSSYKLYPDGKDLSPTAREFAGGDCCYDGFNSAIQIDTGEGFPIYHKSILVPGAERTPYPGILKFLEKFQINFPGSIQGSLGLQEERSVFFNQDSTGIAPVICYESIFGEYVTEYIQKGAELIFIITNDGWWKNTAGHKQHLDYASLRAIETRRAIGRSANTGISCFVNQRGDLIKPTHYWEQDVIRETLLANNEMTFYVQNGDIIGRIALLLSIILAGGAFIYARTQKFKERYSKLNR